MKRTSVLFLAMLMLASSCAQTPSSETDASLSIGEETIAAPEQELIETVCMISD